MSNRSAAKPTAADRYWPHFAAGWSGDERDPITCADCGEDAWVGRSPRAADAANVAHLDASDQTWTRVALTCRACNVAHGETVDHLEPLERTAEALAASRAYHRAARQREGAEHARRAALRAARRGR